MLSITEFSEQSRLILYSFANTAYAHHGDGNVYSSTTTDPAIRNTAYAPHGDGNAFAFCGKSVSAVNTAYAPHGDGNVSPFLPCSVLDRIAYHLCPSRGRQPPVVGNLLSVQEYRLCPSRGRQQLHDSFQPDIDVTYAPYGDGNLLFSHRIAVSRIPPMPLTGTATDPAQFLAAQLERIQPLPITGTATYSSWILICPTRIPPMPLTGTATS